MFNLIDRLYKEGDLLDSELLKLITQSNGESDAYLFSLADKVRKENFGNAVFVRGLIEISNICKNDCIYCGIRKSNKNCSRYRLGEEEILSSVKEGYSLGFRTFVLQGGEDGYYTDERLINLIKSIKQMTFNSAVTLSLGERSRQSYQRLFDAGADRYLLRHETADKAHYQKLHPSELSFENRMECLENLKQIGFQTGCGFMVGSPFQKPEHLVKDLRFIKQFKPQMCGVGPFIPHCDTPFKEYPAGDVKLTLRLLAIIRLMNADILLPSTTALGSAEQGGREAGIKAGANVIMPNLSPQNVREKYMLYNNKLSSGSEAAQSIKILQNQMKSIGYEIVFGRGDHKSYRKEKQNV